jgi:hypothetical protein
MRSKAKLPDNWKPCEVENSYLVENIYTVNSARGYFTSGDDQRNNFLRIYGLLPGKQTKKGKLPENWRRFQKVNSYELYVKDWTDYDTHETIKGDRELYGEVDYLKDRLFYMLYRNVKLG